MFHIIKKTEAKRIFVLAAFIACLGLSDSARADGGYSLSPTPYQSSEFQRVVDNASTPATLSSSYNGVMTEPSHVIRPKQIEEPVSASQVPLMEDASYKLGLGDVLQIIVYGEEGLSNTYRVNQDGIVSIPLAGDVKAAGRSIQELEGEIELRLANGFLLDPNVAIDMISVRPFYILGEVRLPGRYDYSTGMTALNAIAIAGGYTYRANKNEVKLLRSDDVGGDYIEVSVNDEILPGDIILVKERFF